MSAQSGIFHTQLPRPEPRKTSSQIPQGSSARAALGALPPLTTQQLTREVQGIVLQFPTARVVEDTQASQRAIENVRAGESGMSLKTFVNFCRANPQARTLAKALLGFGDESDPAVVQAISVLLNQLVRDESSPGAGGGLRESGDQPVAGDLFGGPVVRGHGGQS